jgi:hypothetical protein
LVGLVQSLKAIAIIAIIAITLLLLYYFNISHSFFTSISIPPSLGVTDHTRCNQSKHDSTVLVRSLS